MNERMDSYKKLGITNERYNFDKYNAEATFQTLVWEIEESNETIDHFIQKAEFEKMRAKLDYMKEMLEIAYSKRIG